MSMSDCFNYQFMLLDYVQNDYGDEIRLFIENNNLNINYYCMSIKCIDKVDYIITSNTVKKKDNGYRLVTINKAECSNKIIETDNNLVICYDNLIINIGCASDNFNQRYCYVWGYNYEIVLDINNAELDLQRKFYNKNHNETAVTKISAHTIFLSKLQIMLLPNLKTIILHGNYRIYFKYPDSLQELQLLTYYNQPLPSKYLPTFLQTLVLGDDYNVLIRPNILPKFLKALTLGRSYKKSIKENVLPTTLEKITFNRIITKKIVLPSSIQQIIFNVHNEFDEHGIYYDQILKLIDSEHHSKIIFNKLHVE
jgi:hypothetical protein